MSTSPDSASLGTPMLAARFAQARAQVVAQLQPLGQARLLQIKTPLSQAPTVEPDNKTSFKLEQLYQLLKCDLVSVVHLDDALPGHILICDEDVLASSEAVCNLVASLLAGHPIYGDVLLCRDEQFQ